MNERRRLIPTAALAGAATLGLVSVTACSSPDTADGGQDGTLQVVASFYPMEFLAERIGGDHISVSGLTEPGTEPHDLEISPRQTAELGEAGMVVYLKGMQPAVDEAIGVSGTENAVDASSLTKREGHPGKADPHIWLDPVKYAEVAEGVGKALEKADPDHAADYRKNTRALVTDLDILNKDFEDGLKNRSTDTFITTHAAFGRLAERYGLKQESIAGLDPESEPSPARVKELHEIAKREKVSTVFSETLVNKRTARSLADDTGLRTDVLDPLEGITDKSRGDDYLEVMRSNLGALKKAVGAK